MSGDFGLPPTLEFLRICGGAAAEALPFAFSLEGAEEEGQQQQQQRQPPFRFPALETLIFSDVPWVTNLTLGSFLLSAKASLRVLHINSCFRVISSMLTNFLREPEFRHGPGREQYLQLMTVNVAHIIGVDDASVWMLVDLLPTLKIINLSFTDITGVAIRAIVNAREEEGRADVECVYVKGCERLSSDAIEYGRSKGLVIVT
jgi:F-box/TPR repeat protein Pof3